MNPSTPTDALAATARAMVAGDKGLLAMDESTGTCNQRFASHRIAQTVEMRRSWRELLLNAPGLCECIGGVILCDETFRQSADDGRRFVDLLRDAGILIGLKVDAGAKDLAACPFEKVTEGLDGLQERLQWYAEMGARFAKWRGVIAVAGGTTASGTAAGTSLPSRACIDANARALARYAALCQEAGLVPIIEPEVLMDGDHTLARCAEVTESVLHAVFAQLARQRVTLEAMILKPNMVVAGSACASQNTVDEVAHATVQCLLRTVPAAVAGIAFLSGGPSGEEASSRLNGMHVGSGPHAAPALPWPLTFSFSHALQHPALSIWAGRDENRLAAQRALLHRARCNRAALQGNYRAAMEAR